MKMRRPAKTRSFKHPQSVEANVRRLRLVEALEEPRLGVGPVAFDGAFREAKDFRRLALAEPDKKPELDDFGFGRVGFLEFIERLVERQNRLLLDGRSDLDLINIEPLLAGAVSDRKALSRAINEDMAHGLSRGGEEVPSSLPMFSAAPDELQPCLMDERRGLQGLPRRLLGHLVRREFAQLIINQRQQFIGSLRVAFLSSLQNARNLAHALQSRAPATGDNQNAFTYCWINR